MDLEKFCYQKKQNILEIEYEKGERRADTLNLTQKNLVIGEERDYQ